MDYRELYLFLKSIISQRIMVLRYNKNRNTDSLLYILTEDLQNKLNTIEIDKSVAYFLVNNFLSLQRILVHYKGYEEKEKKLFRYYEQCLNLIY